MTDSKKVNILMALYGVCAATSTLPCLTTIYFAPNTLEVQEKLGTLTLDQRNLILASYAPFLVIPLTMAVHCGLRLSKMIDTPVVKVKTV